MAEITVKTANKCAIIGLESFKLERLHIQVRQCNAFQFEHSVI